LYENKTLVKFQLIVTLDMVIYINRNTLIVVTQPQFTKQNSFTFSQKKILIKIGHMDHLVLDVHGSYLDMNGGTQSQCTCVMLAWHSDAQFDCEKQSSFFVANLFRINCPIVRNSESDRRGILFYARRGTPLQEWHRMHWRPIHRMHFHPCPYVVEKQSGFMYLVAA
jgi:hypothetical protein